MKRLIILFFLYPAIVNSEEYHTHRHAVSTTTSEDCCVRWNVQYDEKSGTRVSYCEKYGVKVTTYWTDCACGATKPKTQSVCTKTD